MWLLQCIILLSSLLSLSNGYGFYDIENTYKYILKELNETIGLLDTSPILTKWFQQPLDHFDVNETRTFKIKYYERLDYWRIKGPIFLYISGEAPATKGFLQTGIMFELAKETGGAMYLTEHRYYGESKPFKDLTTENLFYLSARQALADLANLLEKIKKNPLFKYSKVVVVGGSYAGNLAAWMKLLYPKLVDAAIASSAPVLAKKNFYEYLETVSNDFEQYGSEDCFNKIKEIFKRYDRLLQSESGRAQLKEEEKICNSTDMSKPRNKQMFFLNKAGAFMSTAQYGTTDIINNFCEDLTAPVLKNASKNDDGDKNECVIYDFDILVDAMKETDSGVAWTYQTCTEFGYFFTTASKDQPFTDNIPVEFYYSLCTKTYGPEFNETRIEEGVKRTNEMYGGLHPNVTNVVFTNGDLDPYHRLGILEDLSYNAPAKVIPRSSHCRILFSNKPSDPEELKEARKYVKYLIKKWIGVGDYKKLEEYIPLRI